MKNLKKFARGMQRIIPLLLSLFVIHSVKSQCNTSAPVTYIVSETNPGEIYIPDASTKPWKGGDTLKILAKYYSVVEIDKIHGDACHPIIIINSGGQVSCGNLRLKTG